MEAILTTLQPPTSSTPLLPKVNFAEESSSTRQEPASNGSLSQQDTILLSKMNRKKRFLAISVERTMTELQRLIEEEVEVKLVERKLAKLNAVEGEYIKAIDEIVAQVDNDDLAEREMEHWEEIRAQIVQAEDQAELYISKNATKSRDRSIKLPLLELPQFAGKILEWPAFSDAFEAAVGSNTKLSKGNCFTMYRRIFCD